MSIKSIVTLLVIEVKFVDMLRVRDLARVIDTNKVKVIYEDYWSKRNYDYVDNYAKVESVSPVDESTIKISITL